MAEKASSQFSRLMTVIPHLLDDEEHRLDDVAAQTGVSRDQLFNDLVSMTQRFDVAGFVDSMVVQVGPELVSMRTADFHRPLRLTMPELCALELGLSMLRQERTPNDYAVIDRALARLQGAITQLPVNDDHAELRHASLMPTGDPEHLALIREAVSTHRMIRLRYRSGRESTSSDRTICPYTLAHADHMWYVITVGDDDHLRHYRLDRIESVELLDQCFESDDSITAKVRAHGRAFASDTTLRMTVRYSPTIARWIAEREGKSLAADGSLTIDHPVADETWAVRHVLQYGPEAEVLGPPEVRAMIRARLEAMM